MNKWIVTETKDVVDLGKAYIWKLDVNKDDVLMIKILMSEETEGGLAFSLRPTIEMDSVSRVEYFTHKILKFLADKEQSVLDIQGLYV
jgi:hypothetical protein